MKKLNLTTFALIMSIFLLGKTNVFAQVGIGTTSPNASSILDISSADKGFLMPRMTTLQRLAISSPANSLLVYDTDLKGFYSYDLATSSWDQLSAESSKRDNYKIIKSEADLADERIAGGGSKFMLSSNTLYEINGTVALSYPIELNGAYIIGNDTNEDILSRSAGVLFTGTTGGSIKGLTLSAPGGTIFSITAPVSESLIFRDSVVKDSNSVGTLSGFGIIFSSVVQYASNITGITYNSVNTLLLTDQGWLSSNGGTYETFTGTFSIVQKVSGFSSADGTVVAIDVSSNPTVGSGVLEGTAFSGTSTQFVKRYASGSYPGYSFTNDWTVDCPGIPKESDDVASGNIYYNGDITTGFVHAVADGNEFNLSGNTSTAVNLFRTSSPENNRITYMGKKKRTFQINAALSIRGNSGVGDYFAFFIKKNGTTTLVETNTLMRVNSTTNISSNAISGTVELEPNDYVEIWGQRLVGNSALSITVFSLNLSIK